MIDTHTELIEQDHYSRIYRKTMDQSICFSAQWELTHQCNLNCIHCYIVNEAKRESLNLVEIKSVIDQLAELGCLHLSFTGGEIFLHPDFFEIAGYAREKNFALRLQTNGTLITQELIQRIKAICPLSVEISLYASTPELHDSVTRVEGSWGKTVNALKYLKQTGVHTVIKSLLMKNNWRDFSDLRKLAESLGAEFVYDFIVVPRNNGEKTPLRYQMTEDEIRRFYLANHLGTTTLRNKNEAGASLLCIAGLNNIFITPTGEVAPCIALKMILGNLKKQSLKEIWQSEQLKRIRGITPEDLTECLDCSATNYCSRCMGLALMEQNNILGRYSIDCQLAHLRKSLARAGKEK